MTDSEALALAAELLGVAYRSDAACGGKVGALSRFLVDRMTPVVPEKGFGFDYWFCGGKSCRTRVSEILAFCPGCGRPINWEAKDGN